MLQQRCIVYIKHRTNYRMKKEALNNKTGSGTPDETFTVTVYNLAGGYQSKDFLSSYKKFKKSIYRGLGKRILHGGWSLVITTRKHPVPKLLTPKCCHIHMQTLVYREWRDNVFLGGRVKCTVGVRGENFQAHLTSNVLFRLFTSVSRCFSISEGRSQKCQAASHAYKTQRMSRKLTCPS